MDANLAVIADVLTSLQVECSQPGGLTLSQQPLMKALLQSLRKAHFVVGVLPEEGPLDALMLELGLAYGLGKRVTIIKPPSTTQLPQLLASAHIVRTTLDDHEAILFSLQQVVADLQKTASRASKGKTLGSRSDLLLAKLQSDLNSPVDERLLLDIVKTALNATGVSLVTEVAASNTALVTPDLVGWSDALEPLFGNPFVVEIKADFTESAVDQVRHYLHVTNAKWGLLLYANGADSPSMSPDSSGRFVLSVRLADLLTGLANSNFADAVLSARNHAAHQA